MTLSVALRYLRPILVAVPAFAGVGSYFASAIDENPEKPAAPAVAAADKPAGRLIRVPLPIGENDNTDTQVKRAIQRALADLPKTAERPVLVLEVLASQGAVWREHRLWASVGTCAIFPAESWQA